MKNIESLAFATIEELAALLAKRRISPVELTELFLRRIERQNPALNAFLTVTAERALCSAAAVRGPKISRSSAYRSRSRTTYGLAASAPPRDRKFCAISFRQRIPRWRENWPARGPSCLAKQI
jgi:hypothetical protein